LFSASSQINIWELFPTLGAWPIHIGYMLVKWVGQEEGKYIPAMHDTSAPVSISHLIMTPWTFKSLNACNPSNCIDVSDKWVKSRKLLPSFQESLWHQTSLNCSHLIHYFFSWELLYCHLYFSFFLLSVLKWSKLELNLHSYKVDICTQTSWKNVLKWCHTKMVFKRKSSIILNIYICDFMITLK